MALFHLLGLLLMFLFHLLLASRIRILCHALMVLLLTLLQLGVILLLAVVEFLLLLRDTLVLASITRIGR